MNFQPKTEGELREEREAKRQLLDVKATYDFSVVNVKEATSKSSGKEMFVVTLEVFHDAGSKQFTDYIVSNQEDKLFALCKSCDLLDAYHSGSLAPEDFAGAGGKLKLGIEKGTAAPDGGFYPDKNKVRQYVGGDIEGKAPAALPMSSKSPFKTPKEDDDDIPF